MVREGIVRVQQPPLELIEFFAGWTYIHCTADVFKKKLNGGGMHAETHTHGRHRLELKGVESKHATEGARTALATSTFPIEPFLHCTT